MERRFRFGRNVRFFATFASAAFVVYYFGRQYTRNHLQLKINVFYEQTCTMGLGPSEVAEYRDLLTAFDALASRLNVTYFLYAGSLLPALRGLTHLPWDDDVDLVMNKADFFVIEQEINIMKTNFRCKRFYLSDGTAFAKFYFNSESSEFRWPYLDVFFFEESGDDLHVPFTGFTGPRTDFLPTTKMKLMGVEMRGPANALAVAQQMYGTDVVSTCASTEYNHRLGQFRPGGTVSVPCHELDALTSKYKVTVHQ